MLRPHYRYRLHNLCMLGQITDRISGSNLRRGCEPSLILAAAQGTAPLLKRLLTTGLDVNVRDSRGRTPLHYAARWGEEVPANVRLLLAAGADIHARDRDGMTPLMLARGTQALRLLQSRKQRITLRTEIETFLKPLLGQPMSDMWRAAGMQLIEFGIQRPFINRKGDEVTRADRSIHISCCWSISGPQGEIASAADFGSDRSRRDEKAYPFYRMLGDPALTIQFIRADDDGGFTMRTRGDYVLTVGPCSDEENEEEDDEYWRLTNHPAEDQPYHRHFVVTSQGVQRY